MGGKEEREKAEGGEGKRCSDEGGKYNEHEGIEKDESFTRGER